MSHIYPSVYQQWEDKQSDRALTRFFSLILSMFFFFFVGVCVKYPAGPHVFPVTLDEWGLLLPENSENPPRTLMPWFQTD